MNSGVERDAIEYRHFHRDDAEQAIRLWRSTRWASVSDSDTPSEIGRLLDRNPGLSWVAVLEGDVIGTVLCGQDGRRGYLYHLVVREDLRGSGCGGALLDCVLSGLRSSGILKCHAMVIDGNPSADFFWRQRGWIKQSTSQYSLIL